MLNSFVVNEFLSVLMPPGLFVIRKGILLDEKSTVDFDLTKTYKIPDLKTPRKKYFPVLYPDEMGEEINFENRKIMINTIKKIYIVNKYLKAFKLYLRTYSSDIVRVISEDIILIDVLPVGLLNRLPKEDIMISFIRSYCLKMKVFDDYDILMNPKSLWSMPWKKKTDKVLAKIMNKIIRGISVECIFELKIPPTITIRLPERSFDLKMLEKENMIIYDRESSLTVTTELFDRRNLRMYMIQSLITMLGTGEIVLRI